MEHIPLKLNLKSHLMMPRRDAKNGGSTAKYHRMTRGGGDDDFVDSQFESPPPKIPIKAIMLSIVLFVGGTSLIVIGALLLTGYIDAKYSDRTWPLLLLGGLMFIPGAYHVRIAYYAWKGYRGYSYDDIPEYD